MINSFLQINFSEFRQAEKKIFAKRFFAISCIAILLFSTQTILAQTPNQESLQLFDLAAKQNITDPNFLKAAEETANISPYPQSKLPTDEKISFDSNLNAIESSPFKARSYIDNLSSRSNSKNQNPPKNNNSNQNILKQEGLYNKELHFIENKKFLDLNEFRDIDGRITPRYSEERLSIYEPKTPTPSRFYAADLSMPETFFPTNNLAKKTGSFYRAYGEIIFIQGTITDSFGVPIQNTSIEIWQTNAAGKYHSLLEPSSEYIDKFFNMSGRAITDNLGNYYFITIMPGATAGRAPHINFNIYHPRFGKLETEMYFEKHPFNQTDYQYLSYNQDEKRLLTAYAAHSDILNPKSIKIFTFNIVMQGIHQYKKF